MDKNTTIFLERFLPLSEDIKNLIDVILEVTQSLAEPLE